jgi:hypothetical protein
MAILLNNVSADAISKPFASSGRKAVVVVRADNYGGGTITIEAGSANDPSSSTRFAVLPNGTFTADATVTLDFIPPGTILQAQLAGSTTPAAVFVDILQ